MTLNYASLRRAAINIEPGLVAFTQKLVQTPSLPGHEGDIAAVIQQKMRELGYDHVQADEFGNVIGLVKGRDGPGITLSSHMDHVSPGDEQGWPHPPFSGRVVDGHLWGRGSVDMKGPAACMVYTPALLKAMDIPPAGDLYVAVSVLEEVGGAGARHLAGHLKTDLVVVGEPSRNTLRRGHRGRMELWVTVEGKSVHAGSPATGINPYFSLANFLQNLPKLTMATDAAFGASSVAPTLCQSDQISPNVTPGHLKLTLDWRNIPSETPEAVIEKINVLLQNLLVNGATGRVDLATRTNQSYTHVHVDHPAVTPSFAISADHPWLKHAQQTLSRLFKRPMPADVWQFVTDGGHFMQAGVPVIGFGPGDERLAHTNRERIPIPALTEALTGYAALVTSDWPPLP